MSAVGATQQLPKRDPYCCKEQTVAELKLVLWTLGTAGCIAAPTPPSVKGAIAAASMFFLICKMSELPKTGLMVNCKDLMLSRTWKHKAAGMPIAAIGGSLGGLAFSAGHDVTNGLGTLLCVSGVAFALYIAFSDRLIKGDYSRVPAQRAQVQVLEATGDVELGPQNARGCNG